MYCLVNGNGHLFDTIHCAYHVTFLLCGYANFLIFVLTLSPFLQTLCLSLILSLSLSLSRSLQQLALFPSFSVTHKNAWQPFLTYH
jgi:hypothetical protein